MCVCRYPNAEDAVAETCCCDSEDRTESLAKGAPVANLVSSPAEFLATLAKSDLEEQAQILSRLERLIDLDRMIDHEEQKTSSLGRVRPAPIQTSTPSMTAISDTSEDKVLDTIDPEEDRHVTCLHDSNLARGGPLPYRVGSPGNFLSQLANSSLEEQAEMIMGLEKLIAQESMEDCLADCEKRLSSKSSRRRPVRKLCSNTRLIRAIRSRPYSRR